MKNKTNLIATLLALALIAGAIYWSGTSSMKNNTTENNAKAAREAKNSGTYINLSAQDFATALEKYKNDPNTILLDVRTMDEYNAGHIKGAKEVDYYAPDFMAKLSALDKNKRYFIYCRSGHRSGDTLQKMKSLGFKEVYNLQYGFNSWKQAGLPIEN